MAVETRIEAPVDRVFAMSCDFENAVNVIEAIKKVEMLTDGPVRVGTRFRETRVMFGRETTEEMEVTALTPGKSYEISADSCGCDLTCLVWFQPDGDATRLGFDMRSKPRTLAAKVMSPLGALMAGSMRKALLSDLESIKRAAEAT
ncbi:MAG: SRPBCC family protein [Planctomycetota bacterium]